jgi:hypothetical protein
MGGKYQALTPFFGVRTAGGAGAGGGAAVGAGVVGATVPGLASPGPADVEPEADGDGDDPADPDDDASTDPTGSPRRVKAAMPAVTMRTRATARPASAGRDSRACGERCAGGTGGGPGIDAL